MSSEGGFLRDIVVAAKLTRTQVIFGVSGSLFSIGIWGLVMGFLSKKPGDPTAYEWDPVAILPAIVSIAVFLMYRTLCRTFGFRLNVWTNRRAIIPDDDALFSVNSLAGMPSTNRPVKLFIFGMFSILFASIAVAIVPPRRATLVICLVLCVVDGVDTVPRRRQSGRGPCDADHPDVPVVPRADYSTRALCSTFIVFFGRTLPEFY